MRNISFSINIKCYIAAKYVNMIKEKLNTFLGSNVPIDVVVKGSTKIEYNEGLVATQRLFITEALVPAKIYYDERLLTQLNNIKRLKARALLDWICMNIRPGADRIRLNRGIICAYLDIKTTAFYDVVNELSDINLINKQKGEWYFVNPYYIFRGDRIKYFKKAGNGFIKVLGKNEESDHLLDDDGRMMLG